MTWLIQTITSSFGVEPFAVRWRSASDCSMTRCATAAVRAASASMSWRRRSAKYARMTTRQDQDRNDRREDEREKQLAVEARADLTQQRAPDTRTLPRHPVKIAVPSSTRT